MFYTKISKPYKTERKKRYNQTSQLLNENTHILSRECKHITHKSTLVTESEVNKWSEEKSKTKQIKPVESLPLSDSEQTCNNRT